jgi:hypothetical protein
MTKRAQSGAVGKVGVKDAAHSSVQQGISLPPFTPKEDEQQ